MRKVHFIPLHKRPSLFTVYRVERPDGTPLGTVSKARLTEGRPWFAYGPQGDFILACRTRKSAAKAVRLTANRIGV